MSPIWRRNRKPPTEPPRIRLGHAQSDEEEAALIATRERDWDREAISAIARKVIADRLSDFDIGDMWDYYPEIGEHDWYAVVEDVRRLIEVTVHPPSTERYRAAYDRLASRAEKGAGP